MGINMMVEDLKAGRDAALENDRINMLNAQLIEANKRALESDRLKTLFLQNMSHEIRTPLNAIIGFSNLIPKSFDDHEKLEKFSSIIKQRGLDLLDLINDILDLSRIESGQLPINIEECDLAELFNDLHLFFSNHKQKIGKEHIEIEFSKECKYRQMLIKADKGKIKQIFVNLLYNSLKFTDNGRIDFGCCMNENNQIEFFVSDTGIGIPEDQLVNVFERFIQLNNSKTNVQKGTGLGLSIVKGLVELLKGNISLKSEPGKGSSSRFYIPYEILEKSPVKIQKPIVKENLNWEKYTVLIVEDDEYNSHYLHEVLVRTKVKILSTENARDALEIINSGKHIDLILMDIKLKGMDGLEASRLVKSKYPQIKIIAQTAFASNADKKSAMDAGCDDYISKPIDNVLLLEMISFHLDLLSSN
jgi:CheY-like chemotaxis protein